MTEAASVGVKKPSSMPPTSRTGVNRAGAAGRKSPRFRAGVGQRSSADSRCTMPRIATVIISSATQSSAGTMPASSSWTIETLVTEP